MTIVVDAYGLSCPEPLLKLKKVIGTAEDIELLVDCQTCVDTCGDYARSKGFNVAVDADGGKYTLTLTKK